MEGGRGEGREGWKVGREVVCACVALCLPYTYILSNKTNLKY